MWYTIVSKKCSVQITEGSTSEGIENILLEATFTYKVFFLFINIKNIILIIFYHLKFYAIVVKGSKM